MYMMLRVNECIMMRVMFVSSDRELNFFDWSA
jgi:hypothetical protein